MARWEARASERLRDGETVQASVPVGDNGVVVTSQRAFAFTPESDGANFRSIERPNVEGVTSASTSDPRWLGHAGRAALGGLAGVGLGLTVDFGSLLDLGSIGGQGASRVGMGGMLAVLRQVSALLGLLDQALLVGGLLALTLALGAFGIYLQSRTKTVRIAVAGDADLHVPAADRSDAVARLQRHLADSSAAHLRAAAVEGGPGEEPGTDEPAADRGTLGTILDSLRPEGPEGPAEGAPPEEFDEE